MEFSATWSRLLAIMLAVPLVAQCGPSQLPPPDTPPNCAPAALIGNDTASAADHEQGGPQRTIAFRTSDGLYLPVRVWDGAEPYCAGVVAQPPRIIVAVHGMNDRAAAFDEIAGEWSGEHCFRV